MMFFVMIACFQSMLHSKITLVDQSLPPLSLFLCLSLSVHAGVQGVE
jgi:hypothetical protein